MCSRAQRISERCAVGVGLALGYKGNSAAFVNYICDGENVGETYYQGRLRYSRR